MRHGPGLATAQRLLPFGVAAPLLYSARREAAGAGEVGAERVELQQLASKSDVIIVCADLNPSTALIIGREFLSGVKGGAVLVNTGRGGLVDSAALLEAVQEGRLAGAGLDTVTPEPLPAAHPLALHPKVVVTPHMGSATEQARTAMAQLSVDNLLAGLRGIPLPAQLHFG